MSCDEAHRPVTEFMRDYIVFLVRVRCRRKERSRSLSHLLMSFLFLLTSQKIIAWTKQIGLLGIRSKADRTISSRN